ncbi:MAG: hypothetical protein AB8F74_17285 [Saprospiraceae bacterium]
MEKTILYPFFITEDNLVSYQKTLKLAEQKAAKVVCFTRVAEEEDLDDVYLHLLALNGYYQTTTNNWQMPKITIERDVEVGKMQNSLFAYLENEQIDILVKKACFGEKENADMEEWIRNYNSKIEIYLF